MRTPNFSAKIINHSHGQGAISLDDIYQRAAELAKIDGRPGSEFTPSDLENARHELCGGHLEEADAEETYYVVGGDSVAGSTGHHIPNQSSDESENAVVELVMEGMEEAEHEQMLAASGVAEDEEE